MAGRPRTRPFGPKRKPGRPRKIDTGPLIGPKRKPGRPRKAVDYVTGYVPPLIAAIAGPKRVGRPRTRPFGPKLKPGRPRKNPAPAAPAGPKRVGRPRKNPLGPKRRPGRPRKSGINTELEAAIQRELAGQPFFF